MRMSFAGQWMKSEFSINDLPLARSANLAISELTQLAPVDSFDFTGAELLYERAYLFSADPDSAHEKSCELLKGRDGLVAINLPRVSDWEMIPAWLGPWIDNFEINPYDWDSLKQACRSMSVIDLLDQAELLGLAASIADQLPPPPSGPWLAKSIASSSTNTSEPSGSAPLVVDLSSLWAGPLCSHLLSKLGCRVIKVESIDRLDGARSGLPVFYQLLNQGKESLTLNFKDPLQIAALKHLLSQADIIIEGSRPRALRNLGIVAEDLLEKGNNKVWISITGYGREGKSGSKIGFGDDAAAAAGTCRVMHQATGEYAQVGDAIADPITGIHAALAAWKSYQASQNCLISLALSDTVSFCLHHELAYNADRVYESCRIWKEKQNQLSLLYPDGVRKITGAAAAPGAHNAAIIQELAPTYADLITEASSTAP